MAILYAVLRTLLNALRRNADTTPRSLDDHTASVFGSDLRRRVGVLEDELRELRHSEVTRAAEHSAMVDQLDRLYKRVSARIARTAPTDNANGQEESPLALRNRLKGR